MGSVSGYYFLTKWGACAFFVERKRIHSTKDSDNSRTKAGNRFREESQMSQKDDEKRKSGDASFNNEPSSQKDKDTQSEQVPAANAAPESGADAENNQVSSNEEVPPEPAPQDGQEPDMSKTPDPDTFDQFLLRTENARDFAKFSFEQEEKREQSLLSQSGRMLTALSVLSAALTVFVRILLENTDGLKFKILLSAGLVLLLLLGSMVLAVISQWRFKYLTMLNGKEFFKKIEEDKRRHVYQSQYNYQWIDQLSRIQESKKANNDKRFRLIHASMIVFFVAIGILLLSVLIVCLSS